MKPVLRPGARFDYHDGLMHDLGDPRAEYTRRREQRRRLADRHQRLHIRIGNARLALAVIAIVLARWAWHRPAAWFLVALVVAGFIALVVIHERVLRARDRARRAVEFYEHGLARIEDRWAGRGAAGGRFLPPGHRYAADLDLFGDAGLFQLLAIARTGASEEALAAWLLDPAPLAAIRARQAAIDELRARLDFREEIALIGDEVREGLDGETLPRWGEEPVGLDLPRMRFVAAMLSAIAATALLWLGVVVVSLLVLALGTSAPAGGPGLAGPLRLLVAVGAVEFVVLLVYRRRVARVIHAVEAPGRLLPALARLLARLEGEEVNSPRLSALRRDLTTSEGTTLPAAASREIGRLRRVIEVLDSRDNLLIRVIAPFLLWDLQCALAIEAWRRRNGARIRRWITATGEYGALASLAAYAWEHPADPYPEFVEGAVLFEAEGLGHPLLPDRTFVRNDLRLGADAPLLVVSGSNMSGKSTLLRTVGVNVVLAMAGAPVRARRLRLAPAALGASIRMLDSLQEGTSRFYAEITRIRELMDLARGPLPLIFLLDELLHGTNSHDRRIGGEAILRGFIARGAGGLVTTHDLALTDGVESLGGRNAHFEDHLEAGAMRFDYRLKDGVVRRSNALELMRWVGLEV